MKEETMYEMARRVAQSAARRYDPFEKFEVRGPFEGSAVFSDGSIYIFKNGLALVHRKNLAEAYNLGCKRTNRRPRA
jgi:hypothetical protein